MANPESELEERSFGAVTVLYGEAGGKYPDGNSLVVRGPEESLIIDPALGMIARRDALPAVDRVLNSHCHEDHWAGNHLFPDVPWHLHEADIVGMQSLDHQLAIYGYGDEINRPFRETLLEKFHYTPRPDALPFRDGDVFELGGSVRVRVVHAPGHTRGHCYFWIEPAGMLYLADADLSSFGPYYGDAWSDLDAFERSLAMIETFDARYWATFHHIGVLEDRDRFRERFTRFCAVIGDRERRLLGFLSEPRSLGEIAQHRFVYRPGDDVLFAPAVERRSAALHLERLMAGGQVVEIEPGRFQEV